MKLNKYEISVIALTLAVIVFCVGYFIGKGNSDKDIKINVEDPENISDPPVEDPKENEEEDNTIEAVGGVVDINKASVEDLESLPGIGGTLAERIVEYREANGEFSCKEEITQVYGIGNSIFERIKDYITVE